MRIRTTVILLVAFLAAFTVAYAQETTGTVSGRVADPQGLAVSGATVTITGGQGSRQITTDADGRFNAPFLTPGTYTVRAEKQGFTSAEQQNVIVRLGQTVDLGMQLAVGGVAETIQVTAASPIVDTATTTIGANLSSELLARIPIGRRFTDTLYVAPGVSDSGTVGRANPSMSGGSGLENQYVVDGVNITNPGYGAVGSYSIVFGSLGTGTPFDFVKEVQVKTGGYEAEFGQSSGGLVNVITKSGTNNIRGTAFGYMRPKATEGEWKRINTTNGRISTTASELNDVGFEVGGPVVRDRVFFFGAFDPQWDNLWMIAPEGFPLRSMGEVPRKRRIMAYSVKGTFQVSANHRLDTSFFGDPAKGEMGPQRDNSTVTGATTGALTRTDTAGFSELKYGGHNQVVKYDGIITPQFLVEGSWARAENSIHETPSVNSNNITDRTITPNVRSGGIGFYEVGNEGENNQWSAKATNLIGDHQVRYGFTYEDINYDNIIQRTGSPFTLPTTWPGSPATAIPDNETVTGLEIQVLADPTFGKIYRIVRANTSNVRVTEQQYTSFFAQDTWRAGSRLTIRPGIRYEQQKLTGNLADFKWDGNWAARIGATYDVTGNGRSKLYGAWGKFYAKIPNDLAARALSADAGVTRADYFDAALTQPVPNGVSAAGVTTHFTTAGLAPADFDPDSRSTYLNEALVGFEWEVAANLSAGVRYVHRNMPRVLEDVGTAPMVAYDLDLVPASVEYFITNPNEDTEVTNPELGAHFEKPIHDYDSVEFTLDKRFADNWGMQASYRWSRLNGTFEGFYRNDNGQSDPAITSLFDFPTNDPSYTAIGVPQFGYRGDIRYLGALGAGPLPNDRPHQLKIFGNYAVPMGLNLGAGFFIGSGRPLTAMAANPNYQSAGEIPEGPRGSGFDTVDGFKERTAVTANVDFHADYAIRAGGERRAIVLFDVFNLLNLHTAERYDQNTESTFGALNPDFGQAIQYQSPLQARFGIRFEF